MRKTLFRNRVFQGSLIFCVLFIAGITLYRQHVKSQAAPPLEGTQFQKRHPNEPLPRASGIPPTEPDNTLDTTKARRNPPGVISDMSDTQTVIPPHHELSIHNGSDTLSEPGADDNPIPQAVIEDSRRDLEWIRADREHQEKFRALQAEWDKLHQEGRAHLPLATPENIDRMLNLRPKEKAAFVAELEAWMKRSRDLQERFEQLRQEEPIRPAGTYTH